MITSAEKLAALEAAQQARLRAWEDKNHSTHAVVPPAPVKPVIRRRHAAVLAARWPMASKADGLPLLIKTKR